MKCNMDCLHCPYEDCINDLPATSKEREIINYVDAKTSEEEYKRRYYQAHREELILYAREYRKNNKKKFNDMVNRYYQEHKEERKEYERNYRETHKEEKKKYKKEYYKANKEKLMEYQREYRRRKREENENNNQR